MRFYQTRHRFYAGGDLHASNLYLHVLDDQGRTCCERNRPAHPDAFLHAVAPFRDGLVVGVACMFAWYWLADLCQDHGIPFVLGHALYMKAIHGAKTKNDKVDAAKSAALLRGGVFPQAHVDPRALRATRDLLRRRTFLVRQRAQFLTHIQNTNSQYNLPPLTQKLRYAAHRADPDLLDRFPGDSVQRSVGADLRLIDTRDHEIRDLELYLTRTAKIDDPQTDHLLRTIPGVGPILDLILLYEIHDSGRFPAVANFVSYARLVRCPHESNGKVKRTGNKKIGHGPLRWALGEAACLLLRGDERAKRWLQRKAKKVGKATALGVLTAKLGRTVYHVWRKQTAFDAKRFLTS
jgi:transposase